MIIIGSHVSFGKDQLVGSVKQALSYGANTFMFYTGAPQNTIRSAIDNDLVKEAQTLMKENNINIDNVICHAPYIINLANKEKYESWQFSINFLKQEIARISAMQIKYIVIHPGNYLKQDVSVALQNIAEALNLVIDKNSNVMILLETMAGKGTECGRDLNELKTILDNVIEKEHVGVCLDTCHLNDSGIDISKFDDYLKSFQELIGLEKIKCVHVNDSKNEIGTHKDRHENIGFGTIGFTNLLHVLNHDLLKDVPKILETPYIEEYPPYKLEIEMIKKQTFNPNLKEDVKNYYSNEENC